MFAASKSGGVVASAVDPYWTSVSLLTNFENNLTFQDGSTNNFAITRTGVVNPSLNKPFSGVGGSDYFNGSGGYLSVADNVALQMGSGAFTIEAFVYRFASGVAHTICAKGGASTGLVFQITSGNLLRFTDTTTNIDSTGTIAANTWTHVAVVRSGTGANQTKLYIGGVNDGTGTSATTFAQTEEFRIGRDRSGAADFNGNISNLRIVKGTAVYTANFTPPTAPLTAIANTSLLITGTGQGMFDNATFVDQGPNALAVTATGSPVYSGRSPFGNTYPGSVLLNGTSQYLTNTQVSCSGNFTAEFWVYNTAASAGTTARTALAGSTFNTQIIFNDNGAITIANGGVAVTGLTLVGTSVVRNQWNHIALVRSGTTLTCYVNGSSVGSGTSAAIAYFDSIGRVQWTPTQDVLGYLSNIRIVNGTAVYTANFTPSTTPLTAITNTSLLVRGDTGAFYDLSNNGNGMTSTGATAVTTQVKKYGAESASYTATSYQTVTDAINLQLGTGDYTIEAWVYRNAAGVLHSLICKGAAATGWLLQVNSSNQLVFTVTSTAILTSTTTIAATTWTFVTVTRSGTSTRLFVGGNLEATATDSTNFNQTNALLVGADRSNANGLNGYLDDIRITKGVARYTANFTPPTVTFPTGP